MKKVRILCGGYGHRIKDVVKLVRTGEAVEVDDSEADRLISLGVAALDVATPQEGGANADPGGNAPPAGNPAEGRETAFLDHDQLQAMTVPDLKRLAEDMGIDTSDCKKKHDYIEAISAETVYTYGEEPPALNAEAPVV